MRDMENIAKLSLLSETLATVALKHLKEFHEEINRRSGNPAYMMEWAECLFKSAAEHRFHADLSDICLAVRDNRGIEDITFDQLRDIARDRWRPRGRHHSSSASSNNMAAHFDEVVLDFIFDRGWKHSWFREAQRKDPEFQAWWEHEVARHEVEREEKKRVEAEVVKVREAARNRARLAFNKGQQLDHNDAKLGWPDESALKNMRSEAFKAAVRKAQEVVDA